MKKNYIKNTSKGAHEHLEEALGIQADVYQSHSSVSGTDKAKVGTAQRSGHSKVQDVPKLGVYIFSERQSRLNWTMSLILCTAPFQI